MEEKSEQEQTRNDNGGIEMEQIALIILAVLTPILTIAGFIVGYNVNATQKIFKMPAKERERSADEIMLERIERAQVYDTTEKAETI